jgi:hypothetical protein
MIQSEKAMAFIIRKNRGEINPPHIKKEFTGIAETRKEAVPASEPAGRRLGMPHLSQERLYGLACECWCNQPESSGYAC